MLPLQEVERLTDATCCLIRRVYARTGSRRAQFPIVEAAVPFLGTINAEGLAGLPVSTSPNLCASLCLHGCPPLCCIAALVAVSLLLHNSTCTTSPPSSALSCQCNSACSKQDTELFTVQQRQQFLLTSVPVRSILHMLLVCIVTRLMTARIEELSASQQVHRQHGQGRNCPRFKSTFLQDLLQVV